MQAAAALATPRMIFLSGMKVLRKSIKIMLYIILYHIPMHVNDQRCEIISRMGENNLYATSRHFLKDLLGFFLPTALNTPRPICRSPPYGDKKTCKLRRIEARNSTEKVNQTETGLNCSEPFLRSDSFALSVVQIPDHSRAREQSGHQKSSAFTLAQLYIQ